MSKLVLCVLGNMCRENALEILYGESPSCCHHLSNNSNNLWPELDVKASVK